MRQRLSTHAKSARKRFQGAVNAAVVVGLQNGEKSTARKVEKSLINTLRDKVFRCPLTRALTQPHRHTYTHTLLSLGRVLRHPEVAGVAALRMHTPWPIFAAGGLTRAWSCRDTLFSAPVTRETGALAVRELDACGSRAGSISKVSPGCAFPLLKKN